MMVHGAHSASAWPGLGVVPTAAAAVGDGPSTTPDRQGVPSAIGFPPGAAHPPPEVLGKRKADAQDNNERLSKRLSLLNLERSGNKLYVPVETPSDVPSTSAAAPPAVERMQVDDSSHKVYIYNLDDELASESDDEDGKLVFLPDIEKHLRDSRIPPHVFANSEGELAGMQLVLYSDPKSITVPEEQDGVRRAILEARQRTREKQRLERQGGFATAVNDQSTNDDDAMDVD